MLPHEQLEHNAQDVVHSGEDFPYCRRCGLFVYLDYLDQCMRCGGREIVWREIPVYAPKPKLLRSALLVAGLTLVIAAVILAVWVWR